MTADETLVSEHNSELEGVPDVVRLQFKLS